MHNEPDNRQPHSYHSYLFTPSISNLFFFFLSFYVTQINSLYFCTREPGTLPGSMLYKPPKPSPSPSSISVPYTKTCRCISHLSSRAHRQRETIMLRITLFWWFDARLSLLNLSRSRRFRSLGISYEVFVTAWLGWGLYVGPYSWVHWVGTEIIEDLVFVALSRIVGRMPSPTTSFEHLAKLSPWTYSKDVAHFFENVEWPWNLSHKFGNYFLMGPETWNWQERLDEILL